MYSFTHLVRRDEAPAAEGALDFERQGVHERAVEDRGVAEVDELCRTFCVDRVGGWVESAGRLDKQMDESMGVRYERHDTVRVFHRFIRI